MLQIKSIAASLAKEYQATLGGAPEAGSPMPASGAGQAGGVKQLVFRLNHSGKYLQLREALKAAVVELAKEQFRRSSNAGAGEGAAAAQEQAAVLHHRLFAQLLDEMHAALKALAAPALPPPSSQACTRTPRCHRACTARCWWPLVPIMLLWLAVSSLEPSCCTPAIAIATCRLSGHPSSTRRVQGHQTPDQCIVHLGSSCARKRSLSTASAAGWHRAGGGGASDGAPQSAGR
jgi:hypothetical protein